jgi:hypothetical protein
VKKEFAFAFEVYVLPKAFVSRTWGHKRRRPAVVGVPTDHFSNESILNIF